MINYLNDCLKELSGIKIEKKESKYMYLCWNSINLAIRYGNGVCDTRDSNKQVWHNEQLQKSNFGVNREVEYRSGVGKSITNIARSRQSTQKHEFDGILKTLHSELQTYLILISGVYREGLLQFDKYWVFGINSDQRMLFLVLRKDDVLLENIQGEINLFKAGLI
jgi:hypothetical protein